MGVKLAQRFFGHCAPGVPCITSLTVFILSFLHHERLPPKHPARWPLPQLSL